MIQLSLICREDVKLARKKDKNIKKKKTPPVTTKSKQVHIT